MQRRKGSKGEKRYDIQIVLSVTSGSESESIHMYKVWQLLVFSMHNQMLKKGKEKEKKVNKTCIADAGHTAFDCR